ncbi:MAG: EF hand [Syntrophorhabdus sp. PtaU1.Bin058]|nr:MAG: EF hand [Syntrophorhabdus sp. PtaU1.Bin058]
MVLEEWVVYWCGTAGDASKVKEPVKMDRNASRLQKMDTSKDGKIQPNECVAFWAGRFVDLDENKDGKMSRDEYMNRMKEMAKMMDLNGDGVITIEEYNISWVGKKKAATREKKPAAEKIPVKK